MKQPNPKISIHDNFISDDAAEYVYNLLNDGGIPYNPGSYNWLPNVYLHSDKWPMYNRNTVINHLVSLIYEYLKPKTDMKIAGIEWWYMKLELGAWHFCHCDRDEELFQKYDVLRYPLRSHVLYLTPGRMIGGETMIRTYPDDYKEYITPEDEIPPITTYERSVWWRRVKSRAGRMVSFDGELPHYVETVDETRDQIPRITLLINAWTYTPLGAFKND